MAVQQISPAARSSRSKSLRRLLSGSSFEAGGGWISCIGAIGMARKAAIALLLYAVSRAGVRRSRRRSSAIIYGSRTENASLAFMPPATPSTLPPPWTQP